MRIRFPPTAPMTVWAYLSIIKMPDSVIMDFFVKFFNYHRLRHCVLDMWLERVGNALPKDAKQRNLNNRLATPMTYK